VTVVGAVDVVPSTDSQASLSVALRLIDSALTTIQHREVVAVSEMTDLLLDVRLAIASVS
jgi:hypothetical protein